MTQASASPLATGPHDRLWHDASPFVAQRERSQDALAAIAETLRARAPLHVDEDTFLALHDAVCRLPETSRASVWASPAAHAWTWRTFAALRTCLREPGDAEGRGRFRSQLGAFGVFVQAVVHVAGAEVDLPGRPAAEAVHLPGTRLVREAGQWVQRPVVHHADARIALLPEALCVPGATWPDAEQSRAMGVDFHVRHVDRLSEALGLIERHQPATFTQLRDHMQVIALLPEDARRYPNASSSEHPGAMLLGAYDDPYDLADHMIHEHYHNRLFALEGQEALLEPSDGPSERFYSPWRDEQRSLRGLLHGAYVFVPVHDYWRAVHRDAPGDAAASAAADHAARAALQLRLAIGMLERLARLTDAGATLLDGIRQRLQTTSMAGAASPAIRAVVDDHVRRFDRAGHATGL